MFAFYTPFSSLCCEKKLGVLASPRDGRRSKIGATKHPFRFTPAANAEGLRGIVGCVRDVWMRCSQVTCKFIEGIVPNRLPGFSS